MRRAGNRIFVDPVGRGEITRHEIMDAVVGGGGGDHAAVVLSIAGGQCPHIRRKRGDRGSTFIYGQMIGAGIPFQAARAHGLFDFDGRLGKTLGRAAGEIQPQHAVVFAYAEFAGLAGLKPQRRAEPVAAVQQGVGGGQRGMAA